MPYIYGTRTDVSYIKVHMYSLKVRFKGTDVPYTKVYMYSLCWHPLEEAGLDSIPIKVKILKDDHPSTDVCICHTFTVHVQMYLI